MRSVAGSACALALSLCVVASMSFAGDVSDTAFTYQGRLLEQGAPADGSFNIVLRLWDAPVGGQPVITSIHQDVLVSDGLFTLQIDVGAEVFDNSERWLEITVKGTTLTPRQPVSRAPYAIQTRGIFVNEAEDVGIGTDTPDGPLHVMEGSAGAVSANTNSIMVLERSSGGFLSMLGPDGASKGILFGNVSANDSGGIIYDQASVANESMQFRTGGNATRMTILDNGNVGIGTISPSFQLQLSANSAAKPTSSAWTIAPPTIA